MQASSSPTSAIVSKVESPKTNRAVEASYHLGTAPTDASLEEEILASSAIQFSFDATHSRYFILKPVGKGTIRKAIRSSTYSLQATVANRLNVSLASASAVVLICSALNSHSFQAAARVVSPIDIQVGKKRAVVEVEWLTGFTSVLFSEVEHLKNPFKGNVRVTESQDGQEIYFEQGMAIAQLLAFRSEHPRSEGLAPASVTFTERASDHHVSPESLPDWYRSEAISWSDTMPSSHSAYFPQMTALSNFFVEPSYPKPLSPRGHPSVSSASSSPTLQPELIRSKAPPIQAPSLGFDSLRPDQRFGSLGELPARSPLDSLRLQCASCGHEGASERIQYFPCRDIVCRDCAAKLSRGLVPAGSQSCPLCRKREEAQLTSFLFEDDGEFDFRRIDTSFLEGK